MVPNKSRTVPNKEQIAVVQLYGHLYLNIVLWLSTETRVLQHIFLGAQPHEYLLIWPILLSYHSVLVFDVHWGSTATWSLAVVGWKTIFSDILTPATCTALCSVSQSSIRQAPNWYNLHFFCTYRVKWWLIVSSLHYTPAKQPHIGSIIKWCIYMHSTLHLLLRLYLMVLMVHVWHISEVWCVQKHSYLLLQCKYILQYRSMDFSDLFLLPGNAGCASSIDAGSQYPQDLLAPWKWALLRRPNINS